MRTYIQILIYFIVLNLDLRYPPQNPVVNISNMISHQMIDPTTIISHHTYHIKSSKNFQQSFIQFPTQTHKQKNVLKFLNFIPQFFSISTQIPLLHLLHIHFLHSQRSFDKVNASPQCRAR